MRADARAKTASDGRIPPSPEHTQGNSAIVLESRDDRKCGESRGRDFPRIRESRGDSESAEIRLIHEVVLKRKEAER